MRRRTNALVVIILTWVIAQVANRVLTKWLDININQQNISLALTYTKAVLAYITGGFGLGFIFGAALFSAWDWPVVGIWLRKQRERLRNKEADEALAHECEEISLYLYEQAALIERVKNDKHWETSAVDSQQDHEKAWREERAAEAREEERIRRQIGPKVQTILVKLQARGVRMNLWGFSLSHYELASSSYFFAELANALRSGTYLEREFTAGRPGLPARM